jgi:hypothetical protein
MVSLRTTSEIPAAAEKKIMQDLHSTLVEANGDAELAATRISDGTYSSYRPRCV